MTNLHPHIRLENVKFPIVSNFREFQIQWKTDWPLRPDFDKHLELTPQLCFCKKHEPKLPTSEKLDKQIGFIVWAKYGPSLEMMAQMAKAYQSLGHIVICVNRFQFQKKNRENYLP